MAGVSRASITKACRKQLVAAMVGDRVDVDAPCVVEYLAGRAPAPTVSGQPLTPSEIESLADALLPKVLRHIRRLLREPNTRGRGTS